METETVVGNKKRPEAPRKLNRMTQYTHLEKRRHGEGSAVTAIPISFRVRSEKRVWEDPGETGKVGSPKGSTYI